MGRHSSSHLGTALGIGTGIALLSLFGLSTQPSRQPVPRHPRPEAISITFVGLTTDILVATETTEYAHCDPIMRDQIAQCTTQAPGPIVQVTVVVPSKEHVLCRSRHPTLFADHDLLIARLKRIEIHAQSGSAYCEYDVIRTTSVP